MFSYFKLFLKKTCRSEACSKSVFYVALAFLFLSLLLIKAYSETLKRIFKNVNLKKHSLGLFLLICLDNITFKGICLN